MLCMAPLTRYLMTNTRRHTTLGPTNDRTISRWASGGANNGNVGDIGAGHDEVRIRNLSIIAKTPSHLSLVLGVLLLTVVVVLI